MSKIKLTGDASGTGTLTIAAPNTDTDYSVTLPEVDGGEFVVTNSSGNVGIGTSSPAAALHIASSQPVIRLDEVNITDLYTQLNANSSAGKLSIDIDPNDVGASSFFTVSIDGSERMRIDSSGNLLVGKTSAGLANSGLEVNPVGLVYITRSNTVLGINRTGATGTAQAFYNDGVTVGTISVGASTTSYNTSSDYRLKTDVQPMTGATERLKQLKPVNFEWISDGTRVDGFIAHEAAEVVPEAVTGTKDAVQVWEEGEELPEGVAVGDNKLDDDGNTIPEYQGIDQSKLTPLLTAALQEAIAKIEDLESRIAALETA